MRTLSRNKQRLIYYIEGQRVPIYEKDDEGNTVYTEVDGEQVPIETGEYETLAGGVIDFKANINSTLTATYKKAYGVEDSADTAIIVSRKGEFPFKVGTRIWRTSKVVRDSNGNVDIDSADYVVSATNTETLNEDSFLLKRVDHAN